MNPSSKIEKPFALIIFGASGDLAKLKLFPAIYSLAEQKRLPEEYYIIGYGRTEKQRKEFQKDFQQSVSANYEGKVNKKILKQLAEKIHYVQGKYDKPADYQNLQHQIKSISGKTNITKLAYFSVPPVAFMPIVENLGKIKTKDLRLIIEKPFGEDTASARELFHFVARYFSEDEVFLLDHYLGKTAVQSLLHMRHSNRILNLMLKGTEIAKIEISALEEFGVKERAGYFNKVGTIKDMVQSHLLQILAMITMSIPITEDADSLHREKQSILSALKFSPSKNNLIIGQYNSYTKEKDVPDSSKTDTFIALKLFIDRETWHKTPIFIRSGKKLKKKHTYVVVELKKFDFQPQEEEPNRLIFELQPDEKISIKLVNKYNNGDHYQEVATSAAIACQGPECLPEHAMLLLDVMANQRRHFLSFQEIIASWELTDSIIKHKTTLEKYPDGSNGPESQYQLNDWHEL